MLVVADTSALIALASCDSLELLEPLYNTVRVPPAVLQEATVEGQPHAGVLATYLAERVEPAELQEHPARVGQLDRGELEAMALYRRLGADFLLVDDLRARNIAEQQRIEIIGSIGVLLRAKEKQRIEAVKPFVDRMRTSTAGVRISDDLYGMALRIAGE